MTRKVPNPDCSKRGMLVSTMSMPPQVDESPTAPLATVTSAPFILPQDGLTILYSVRGSVWNCLCVCTPFSSSYVTVTTIVAAVCTLIGLRLAASSGAVNRGEEKVADMLTGFGSLTSAQLIAVAPGTTSPQSFQSVHKISPTSYIAIKGTSARHSVEDGLLTPLECCSPGARSSRLVGRNDVTLSSLTPGE